LQALAGLVPLDAGQVRLDGHVLEDAATGRREPPQHRQVGVVFQDYRLFPHLTARDNVAFGPRSTGTPRAAARREADRWLEHLGLVGLGDRRPAQLSGGQAQRVALARALCTRPRLLLLDEPLSALDVSTRNDVRAQLREQLHAFDRPVLLVTHDPLEALTLANRLLVLEGGVVVQAGRTADVTRRPATSYVARLVGLNLLSGTLRRGELDLGDGVVVHVTEPHLTGPALAVIRPSAVLLHRTAPTASSARNTWTGRVRSLEALADRVRIGIAGPPDLFADVTAHAVSDLHLGTGDQVWMSVKATDIDVYPAPA
jgi:molybdate transport system ATP-binding protein